jgi:hypothetical protein
MSNRPATLLPSQKRGMSAAFLAAVGWPRFDPRPEGKGAGVCEL